MNPDTCRSTFGVSEKYLNSLVDLFCSVCDYYKKGGPCFCGDYDQKRYALRDWCGWADVNGVRASVTLSSIEINGQEFPRESKLAGLTKKVAK
jgi:hypothetical protein